MSILVFSPQDAWRWLTAPSVIPWTGLVAAMGAAAIGFRPVSRSWWGLLRRLAEAAVVWLLVAGLLTLACRTWAPDKNLPRVEGLEPQLPTGGSPPGGESTVVSFPEGSPDIILVIAFVPQSGEPRHAQDFACDLVLRDAEPILVRATDMPEFEKQLVAGLRRVPPPADPAKTRVTIFRTPYPGEGVLRQVRQKVQNVLGDVTVQYDESK